MPFQDFNALLQHAKDATLNVAVLTGAFNNLTGAVTSFDDKVLCLTAQGPTEIYIDRSKIFGMFIAGPAAPGPTPVEEPTEEPPEDDKEEPSAQGNEEIAG